MANELSVPYSGSATLYASIVRTSDLYHYQVDIDSYVVENIANWTKYAVPLTNSNEDLYTGTMPSSSLSDSYIISYREQAGATPSKDDLILRSDKIYWTGAAIGSPAPAGDTTPVLSSEAIVGLSQVKRFLNINTTDVGRDYLLTDIINYITSRFTSVAGRRMKAQMYKETLYTNNSTDIVLSNYPIKYIKSVTSGLYNVLKISTPPLTYMRATVGFGVQEEKDIDATGQRWMEISLIDNNGEETNYKIDLFTYKTTAALTTYINANIPSVTATNMVNTLSRDLWMTTNVDFSIAPQWMPAIYRVPNYQWYLNRDIGAIKLYYNEAPEWVQIEYFAGIEPSDPEYSDAQASVIECVNLMYAKCAKDPVRKSMTKDMGDEGSWQMSYHNDREIDNFILMHARRYGDIPLSNG